MYMNPIKASNQTFGCDGTSVSEHIFVYWVGPLLASVLAVIVHRRLSHLVRTHAKLSKSPDDRGDRLNGSGTNGKSASQNVRDTHAPNKERTISANNEFLAVGDTHVNNEHNMPRLRKVNKPTTKS